MSLRLNAQAKRLPFGGHQYHAYGTAFRGETLKEVVKDLSNFRINNNIPIGDPEQDILTYYVEKWPWMVRDGGRDAEEVPDTYSEWRESIYRIWKTPPKKMLATKEAATRWAICEKCPFNQPIPPSDSVESKELVRRSNLIKRGSDTPKDLGFCGLHKMDLGILSLIDPAKEVSIAEKGKSHPGCWV